MQSEVMQVISGSDDGITEKALRQRFKDWRKRDLDEVLDVLKSDQKVIRPKLVGGLAGYATADTRKATL
jgi:predicted alpha/beta hydrolase